MTTARPSPAPGGTSLVLIARNAADLLPRCLDACAGLFDEGVAVINDCTDDTAERLRARGFRVEERPWAGMAAQKQAALALATRRWVLHVDTDEVVSPELSAALRAFLAADGAGAAGATCNRCSWFMGRWIRHGDWYPDRVLRVFRRESGRFEGRGGHDRVIVTGPLRHLRGDLQHHSYPDLDRTLAKLPAFADAFVADQQARGRRFSAPAAAARAVWRFLRAYVLRGGCLDGFPGLYIATWQAFFTLYRHARLREAERESKTPRPVPPG